MIRSSIVPHVGMAAPDLDSRFRVPEGWRSISSIAVEYSLTEDTVRGRLKRLVPKGLVKSRSFLTTDIRGHVVRVNHYKSKLPLDDLFGRKE